MDIYQVNNYRSFVRARIRRDAGKRTGQTKRISIHLGVHSSLITRVLKGAAHFTPDQAFLLAEYFGLNEAESDYFISLVNLERAGNSGYRKRIQRELDRLKSEAKMALEPNPSDHPLSASNQSIYYSQWYYGAIRLLPAVPKLRSAGAMARQLKLPLPLVDQVVRFLLATGLLLEEKDGELSIGPRNTRLAGNSPELNRHLFNWRMKGLDALGLPEPDTVQLFHSSPLVIAESARGEAKALLLRCIEEILKLGSKGEREELACLNIDWFRI